jgi:hypothetical protein
MKNLITTVVLVLAANSASAAGFSPWTDAATAPQATEIQNVTVDSAGFAPWRDHTVTRDVHQEAQSTDVAINQGESNGFRPWS